LPINFFLLLLLHLFVGLELVSNKSTTPCSKRTTDKRPCNRMANGTTDQTSSSSSSQSPDCCAFCVVLMMVQSGLTPIQVIQSFSKGASEALGIDKEFGTLAKGKAADLLVLEKNPLDSITNMRTIQTIYLGGKKFE
jgi:alpha-D-ribose 1-methylphosphonate 5-triphosphate diphosphatase PhnM